MDLRLIRDQFRSDGIFSTLFDSDNNQLSVTLEHAYPVPGSSPLAYAPILQPGVYTCVRGTHKLESGVVFETFEITGVAGHTGVLFHWGNINRESKGCVLTGEAEALFGAAEGVTNSIATFKALMALQAGVDTFQLTVEEDDS